MDISLTSVYTFAMILFMFGQISCNNITSFSGFPVVYYTFDPYICNPTTEAMTTMAPTTTTSTSSTSATTSTSTSSTSTTTSTSTTSVTTASTSTSTTTTTTTSTSTTATTSTSTSSTTSTSTTATTSTSTSSSTSTSTTSTSTSTSASTSTSSTSTSTTSTSSTSTSTTSTSTTSTTSTSTTSTTSTSATTTTTTDYASTFIFIAPSCPNQTIGLSCNFPADPCTMSQPCQNLATCYGNVTLPLGYSCTCRTGYTGFNCEVDDRICRPGSSCLYGGSCNETSNITDCTCPVGKIGNHCEYENDTCDPIKCENGGICVSIFGNWSCRCTNPDLYSGAFCEIKSSTLRVKEIVSRSFASVAIGCIATVVGFVLMMDALKYIFHIDLVVDERDYYREREYERQKERRNRERQRRGLPPIGPQPTTVMRFQYIPGDELVD